MRNCEDYLSRVGEPLLPLLVPEWPDEKAVSLVHRNVHARPLVQQKRLRKAVSGHVLARQ